MSEPTQGAYDLLRTITAGPDNLLEVVRDEFGISAEDIFHVGKVHVLQTIYGYDTLAEADEFYAANFEEVTEHVANFVTAFLYGLVVASAHQMGITS